ncbi:hypothetical protein L1987_32794 [Smallanthus sonchifolius]|uniref:Uncharacterized protein n=1 Tax=Smallanthus sonchifolius TaxID=185202 RepID=A0ACB9HQG4_9ASTR|nr:hypothetical protein L1987_32794 [Smallanthus sonchifolius]
MLDLKPGQKVLDVGCGIGGGDFYMAENFDVDFVGIDLSLNMIPFALEHAIGLKCYRSDFGLDGIRCCDFHFLLKFAILFWFISSKTEKEDKDSNAGT